MPARISQGVLRSLAAERSRCAAAASVSEPALRSTAEFDGDLGLRQQLDEVAIWISQVDKRSAGRMLAACDERTAGRLDLRDRGVEI